MSNDIPLNYTFTFFFGKRHLKIIAVTVIVTDEHH